MKTLSEIKALRALEKLTNDYRDFIQINYEHRAQNCATCPTKGACCLDAHFVNVRITRLEAAAIGKTLGSLSEENQRKIYRRALETVEKYDLNSTSDALQKTFACPLFETGVGCLVHYAGKPAPCIAHACYENRADLPPECFQEEIESQIDKLNRRTYGGNAAWLPLPVWLDLLNPNKSE